MNKWELFKLLRKHRSLAGQRMINSSQKTIGQVFSLLAVLFCCGYLAFLSTALAMIANSSRHFTAVEIIMGMMPFFIICDFYFRFSMQKTPSQIVKPYLLLPLSKFDCIDTFIISSVLSWGNLIWFSLFVPYCIMSIVFSYSLWMALLVLFVYALVIAINCQWYLIVRTLLLRSWLYFVLPLIQIVVFLFPLIYGIEDGLEKVYKWWTHVGTALDNGNPLPVVVLVLLLATLVYINRRLQFAAINDEVAQENKKEMRNVSQFNFLNRFNDIGQFLKLEIKSTLRNKNPRKAFVSGISIVFIFSMLISFTDIYDDSPTMGNYLCSYNFVIFGLSMLTGIMSYEGNYIEALMVRKENILNLLHAKFYYFVCLLFVPLILMIPTVITGKWTLLHLLAYFFFTAGFQHFVLFQLAVYNKQTMPLNTKLTSKDGTEVNYFSFVFAGVPLLLPTMLYTVLDAVLSDNQIHTVFLLMGIFFLITERIWMRNIYNRFMKRRYKNMEAMRASR